MGSKKYSYLEHSLIKKLTKEWSVEKAIKQRKKNNFFTFEVWKSSLDVRYWIDGVIILTIAVLLQIYIDELTKSAIKQTDYAAQYYALAAQLQNPTLPPAQRLKLYQEFQLYEKFWIEKADDTLSGFLRFMYYSLLLSSYLIKNIMQLIVAKLSSTNFSLFGLGLFKSGQFGSAVIPELTMNFIQICLVVYVILMYHFYYSHLQIDPEKFKSVRLINRVTQDDYMKYQAL